MRRLLFGVRLGWLGGLTYCKGPRERQEKAHKTTTKKNKLLRYAPHRVTAITAEVARRTDIRGIDEEVIHTGIIVASRRPEVPVGPLKVRRPIVEVARKRSRQRRAKTRGDTTIGCIKRVIFSATSTSWHTPTFRADVV